MLHVNITKLYNDVNKSHVNIIMLHVDIIYLACRGRNMPTYNTFQIQDARYLQLRWLFISFHRPILLSANKWQWIYILIHIQFLQFFFGQVDIITRGVDKALSESWREYFMTCHFQNIMYILMKYTCTSYYPSHMSN